MEILSPDSSWITIFVFFVVAVIVVIVGAIFLKRAASLDNGDPLKNPPFEQRLGFSLTLTGLTLTMCSLILIMMKLARY